MNYLQEHMQFGPHTRPLGRALVVAAVMVMMATTAVAYASSAGYSSASRTDLPLEIGDRSAEVRTLQALLDSAGFDPGPIDGIFGPLTAAAVSAFQTAKSLPATGVVDQATWDLLIGGILLQRGQRGDSVRSLQQSLAGAGFDPGPIDGIFGGLTESAVSRYQSARGLPVTGSVDQATWDLLTNDPAAPAVLFRRGDRGDGVRSLQLLLAGAGVSPGPIDGIFGGLTESAVSGYQSANSLPVTGTVDQAMWDRLQANTTSPDALLQTGDRGPEVETLQRLVKTVGFDPGPIDGIFGSLTARAVRRIQGVHGLAGDGTVTQQTLDEMKQIEPLALTAFDYGYTGSAGVEQWRGLVTDVFGRWGLDQEACGTGANASNCIGPQIENALVIMQCESRGVPMVVNYLSGTTGLFQHRPSFWAARTARVREHFPDFDVNATPYNPEHNIMAAALLVWESRETLIGNSSRTGPWDDGPEPWGHWTGSARTCANPPLVSP